MLALPLLLALAGAVSGAGVLRVCADANNLPYSNEAGEGFENALARLLADELGWRLEYTWWPQRRGFVRNTLDAGRCDVIMGVPAGYEMAATTRPYYRSTYALVSRAEDGLDIDTLEDPRLRELRIGVHTVGDDYGNPPPAQVLGRLGVREQVRGYSIYGDYSRPNPPARLIEAVAAGEIDVAIAWGPIAGFFAGRQERALRVTPVSTSVSALPMAFDMALGLRREDAELRRRLDAVLERRAPDVLELLARYGVPALEPLGRQGKAEQDSREVSQ